jgi:hypothetical protein
VVQWCFNQAWVAQHPGEDRLAGPVAPDLCQDGGRQDHLDPVLGCDLQQRERGSLGIAANLC